MGKEGVAANRWLSNFVRELENMALSELQEFQPIWKEEAEKQRTEQYGLSPKTLEICEKVMELVIEDKKDSAVSEWTS